jgi:hypothetical protein
MQGLYYRPSARRGPWTLVRATKSVGDAETLARATAATERRGRLLYLESPTLPLTVWDMRSWPHRKLGGWLAKALLDTYARTRQNGRVKWIRTDPRQLLLFP